MPQNLRGIFLTHTAYGDYVGIVGLSFTKLSNCDKWSWSVIYTEYQPSA